jgi:Tol biopolymer transport system component
MKETVGYRPSAVLGGLLVLALSLLLSALFAPSAQSAFPGGNGKIVFASTRDGNQEIYTMNADGTGPTRRTNNAASDFDPAWSPDGAKIAFLSNRSGNQEIYTMNADGTAQTQRTSNGGLDLQPTWSPDGTKIAFTSNRDGNLEIYTMNADGTVQTNRSNNPASDLNPSWSPDGTKIVFASTRDGNQEIYTMNADGTGQTRRTNNAAEDRDPVWSPDGTKIAFLSTRDGNQEIYTMNADGTGQTRRTNNAADDLLPTWSPDGTKIAFTSRRDSNDEIYTMNADGTGQTNRSNNAAVDFFPEWQPLSYQHPKSTPAISVGLVPSFRQTISATQCTARGGTPGQHAAPNAVTSCDPPTPVPGTSASFGSDSVASATLTPVAGDPTTLVDEADYAVSVSLTDIEYIVDGSDYFPNLKLLVRLRITDKGNCSPPGCGAPFYRPGTSSDINLAVPFGCATNADPAIGSTCSINTTADAVTPGFIVESRQTVIDAFRVRVNDAGVNGLPGDSDDKEFAQQGSFIP